MKKFSSVEELFNNKSSKQHHRIEIRVGLSTCGIAAGGKKVFEQFKKELEQKNIEDVELKRVGCLGLCYSEPNVEVLVDGMPSVLYGKVNEELVHRILDQHIIRGVVLDTNIFDKPYTDVLSESAK